MAAWALCSSSSYNMILYVVHENKKRFKMLTFLRVKSSVYIEIMLKYIVMF